MLTIRLTRRGRRNRPFFRIVVAEASAPIKGRFIEILGYLDPLQKKSEVKAERIKYWLGQGAQTSATVHNLLIDKGVIKGSKINKFAKKKRVKEEKKEVKQEVKKEEKPSKETGEGEKPQKKQSLKAEKPQAETPGQKTEELKEKQKESSKVKSLPIQDQEETKTQ